MDIEEINKLIEEIERDNREYYWKLRERKREKKLQERVRKIKKKKNTILTISVPSLLIALLYIKQYINYNFNNIYKENTIKISSEKIKNIKEEIEKTFRIRIDEETTNKYLLLNALLENSSLSYQEKKIFGKKVLKLIKKLPYLNQESAYYSLFNLDVYYTNRPSYEKATVLGEYIYEFPCHYYQNDIYIYDRKNKDVSSHELIHCLLMNQKNQNFPYFITEGITELLTNEFFQNNQYVEKEIYPFEIVAVKILCEIISGDILIKSYVNGNINTIYEELNKIDKTINPKMFIEALNNILIKRRDNKIIQNTEMTYIEKAMESYIEKVNKTNNEACIYYLELFNNINKKNSYTAYLNTINSLEYVSTCYFNKETNKNLSKKKLNQRKNRVVDIR